MQGASPVSVSAIRRRHPLRRLYNWVLSFAHKKDSERALFAIAAVESSILPLPLGLFLVTLCLGAVEKSFRFAFVCSAGSILGGMIAYGLGYGAWQMVEPWLVPLIISPEMFAKAERLYASAAWWAILTTALTPLSYRTSAWVAGAFGVNFGLFLMASVIGRPIRFLLMAALVHFFGERARHIIERHLGIALLIAAAVVIAGYVIVKAIG